VEVAGRLDPGKNPFFERHRAAPCIARACMPRRGVAAQGALKARAAPL
jgi:hypothetical protein